MLAKAELFPASVARDWLLIVFNIDLMLLILLGVRLSCRLALRSVLLLLLRLGTA